MMEDTKSFEELSKEYGGTVKPWIPSKEFINEFQEYMRKSIMESRENMAKAIESARKTFITF